MAEPGPPLPVAQRRVHQHSRASFPLHPLPFPHHPPSQPSLVARALVSQSRDDVRHSGVHIRRRLMLGCRDSRGRGRRDSCATPAAGASSLRWAEAERGYPAWRVGLGIAGTGVAEGRWRSWPDPLSSGAAWGAPFRAGRAVSPQPALRGPPWARPHRLPPTRRKSGERLRAPLSAPAPPQVGRAVPAVLLSVRLRWGGLSPLCRP